MSDIPTIQPGQSWVCEDGVRHFVCYMCHGVFTSDPGFTPEDAFEEAVWNGHAPISDEDTVSVCDDCTPVLLGKLREKGLVP